MIDGRLVADSRNYMGIHPRITNVNANDRTPNWLFWCRSLVRRRLQSELERFDDYITGPADLFGSKNCSLIFLLFGGMMSKQLTVPPKEWKRRNHCVFHKAVNCVVRMIAPLILSGPQIIDKITEKNDSFSSNSECAPKIWIANHRFRDDVLATITAVGRPAYVIFGSLPMLFNSLEGIAICADGIICCNRKVKKSRVEVIEKAILALQSGIDIILFPEGVWNKTPEKLVLPFFPGVYRIAKATGAEVVPVVHYLRDLDKKGRSNPIHTVVEEPIAVDQMNDHEALEMLRDRMASRYFEMMKLYGNSCREVELGCSDTSKEAWESLMAYHTGKVRYYDKEIELYADYRNKHFPYPETVWEPIANIQNLGAGNATVIHHAQKTITLEQETNFQRRF